MNGSPRHFSILESDAPTGAERSALALRATELKGALSPTVSGVVVKMISAMRQWFPTQRDADFDALLKTYVATLSPLPEWAIAEVCRRYTDGKSGDGTFAPTPAKMAKEIRALLVGHQEQLAKIERILNAEIAREEPPEVKARMLVGFEELRREIGVGGLPPEEAEAKQKERSERIKAENQARIDRENRALGYTDGLPLSPQLRRSLEKMGAKFDRGGE